MGEFDFERGEILTNLTLLEDHATKFHCPFCEEKPLSKLIGYAEEIAAGKEGDEATMQKFAEEMRSWREKISKDNGGLDLDAFGKVARDWRRKLQGAGSHVHSKASHVEIKH